MSAPVQRPGEQELARWAAAIATSPGVQVDSAVAQILAAADHLGEPRPGRPTLLGWLSSAGVQGVSDWKVQQAIRKASNVSVVRGVDDDTVIVPAVVNEPIAVGPAVVEPVASLVTEAPTSTEPVTTQAAAEKPAGAKGFYAVAFISIGVSVDTSWRFFEQRLGITNVVERAVLFSVMEAALIACGWSMRGGVRRDGKPGPARLVAWALTAFAAYAAFSLSGLEAGIARVALGPVLGLVMLHLALGIDLRASHQSTTTWARIGRELRERMLSVLGLGNDERDALARTRDRAALRAAKLSVAKRGLFRQARLRKALHASNVAHDPVQRARMLAELNVLQHAATLAETKQLSPWPVTQP